METQICDRTFGPEHAASRYGRYTSYRVQSRTTKSTTHSAYCMGAEVQNSIDGTPDEGVTMTVRELAEAIQTARMAWEHDPHVTTAYYVLDIAHAPTGYDPRLRYTWWRVDLAEAT